MFWLILNQFWLLCISYQMNPANYREALVEMHEDESEGADILLVFLLMLLLSSTSSRLIIYLFIYNLLFDYSALITLVSFINR